MPTSSRRSPSGRCRISCFSMASSRSSSSRWADIDVHSPDAMEKAPAMSNAIPARRTTLGPASAPAMPRINDTLVTRPSATPNTAARAPPPWMLRWWWSHMWTSPAPLLLGWASDARRPNSRGTRARPSSRDAFTTARLPTGPRSVGHRDLAEWPHGRAPTLVRPVAAPDAARCGDAVLRDGCAQPAVDPLRSIPVGDLAGAGSGRLRSGQRAALGVLAGDRDRRAHLPDPAAGRRRIGLQRHHHQPGLHGRPRGPVPPSPEPRVPAHLVQVGPIGASVRRASARTDDIVLCHDDD